MIAGARPVKAFFYRAWYGGVIPLLGFLLFLFALAFFVGGGTGCKPAAQPDKFPAYCYDDDDFIGAVAKCALTAPSREASRACRAAVLKSCGITEAVSARSVSP